ncbi:unnamed protein product [Prorocentrum cordatum]|uniref:Mei2-like C-terminal RNA recognition motif domain-containing protein n=1 Tax=Prorocentrum cordatum TaxID=2364126 RepID=A0ABN9T304_9DINO|nr:unnamed protein product [Polarella glacialis]
MAAAPAARTEEPKHPSPAARGPRPRAPEAALGAALPWPPPCRPADLGSRAYVVRNTFLHFQDCAEEDVALLSLRPSSSAPALLPTLAGPEVPIVEPPSSIGAERRTTVVFRNVPYLLTRDMLVKLLNSQGFRGQFDLVYLPMDFRTNQALGYAFVNAVSAEVAIRLFGVFEGFQAWPKRSSKVCSVCWSNRQGFERNLHAYLKLSVMQTKFPDAWKPAFFSQGSQVPFPKPAGKIARDSKNPRGAGDAPRI